jgi:hypothetical protein
MYRVDCRTIESFEDFIEAFNRVLIEPAGGKWNGNLDAFNDYLSWPEEVPYRLEILGTGRCEQVLNYVADKSHGQPLWPLLKEILLNSKKWVAVDFK